MAKDIIQLNTEVFSKRAALTLIDEINKVRELTVDGPIGSAYNETSPKILWVLREAHGNGGSSLISDVNEDLLDRENPEWPKWYSTWGLVIKVSDSILSSLPGMNTAHPSTLKQILKRVAVINLNKFGGGGKLSKHYLKGANLCRQLTGEQIQILQPDIIIYAGTGYDSLRIGLNNFASKDFWPSKDNFPSVQANGRIHISAYHTGQRKIKHKKYCDMVIAHLE